MAKVTNAVFIIGSLILMIVGLKPKFGGRQHEESVQSAQENCDELKTDKTANCPICHQCRDYTAQQEWNVKEQGQWQKQNKINVFVGIFTAVAAIGAWLAYGAASQQAGYALDALNNGETNFRIDERAWVEIEPIQLESIPCDSGCKDMLVFNVYAKNVGKTVARNVVIRAVHPNFDSMLSIDDINKIQKEILLGQPTTLSGNRTVFPPPINNNGVLRSKSDTLAPSAITLAPLALAAGEMRLMPDKTFNVTFLIGRIDYKDAFGADHWKTFCESVGALKHLVACEAGNDEDSNSEPGPSSAVTQGRTTP